MTATAVPPSAAVDSPVRRSTTLPIEADVLIVGLGPVGAIAACLLGRYGVRVLAIDQATEPSMAPRAIALDNEALRILQLAGLEEAAFERLAIPYVRMRSPWLGEFARVNTLGAINGHPKLVTFFQPDLEAALRRQLMQHGSVKVMLGTTLEGLAQDTEGVTASIDLGPEGKTQVRASYLIGADGASSLVRRLIGQQFEGKTYAEDWLIVDALDVPRPIDHVEFLCDHRRPTPHMAAPGGRERWEFKFRRGERREEMETEVRIAQLLARWADPAQLRIERKACYRFHARAADAFSQGRVFLAGDAAHITPPFVGQGLVAGLRDALNLSWKLAWVVQGRAAPRILDSYDSERRPHANAMIRLARLIGTLVMPRNAGLALLTHGGMRLLRMIPPLRTYFDELGIKPSNTFRSGLFVRGRSHGKLVRGGLLAQGHVRGADGTVRLSDDVLGSALTLVGFGRDPKQYLDEVQARRFASAGGAIVQIAHRGQHLHLADEGSWEDLEGVFLPRLAPVGWGAVVRPDRTVVHDGPIEEAGRLVNESLDLLGHPVPRAVTALSSPISA